MKACVAVIACLALLCAPSVSQAKPKHKGGANNAPAPTPPPIPPDPSAALEQFLEANLNKILAPLGSPGFGDEQKIVDLGEKFADDMVTAPETMKPAFQAGVRVCGTIIDVIDTRAVASGEMQASGVVHAGTTLGATTGWTDPRASWAAVAMEFQKERDRRKDADKNAKQTDQFFNAAAKTNWAKQAEQLKASIENLYEQQRQIERDCKAKEAEASQKRALEDYPDLAKAGSPLKKEYDREYLALKTANDPLLKDPDWPERLAAKCDDKVDQEAPAKTEPAPAKVDQAPAKANQPPTINTDQPPPDSNGAALSQAIVKNPYTWDHGKLHHSIAFNADGTGQGEDFKFTWKAMGPREVEMTRDTPSGRDVHLTFSADFSSYAGTLAQKDPKVSGHQVVPKTP